MNKKALFAGIAEQDSAYLAKLLGKNDHEVHGIKRRALSVDTNDTNDTNSINHQPQDLHVSQQSLALHYGDLSESRNLIGIVQEVKPDEIFKPRAMGHGPWAGELRPPRVHGRWHDGYLDAVTGQTTAELPSRPTIMIKLALVGLGILDVDALRVSLLSTNCGPNARVSGGRAYGVD